MNRRRLYLLFFPALSAALFGCMAGNSARKFPDLKESYQYTDKKPFGAYIAFHQVQEMFYRNTIREEKRSFEEGERYLEDTASLYICVTHTLYSNNDDAESLARFIEKGNNVFIVSREFDENLLDKLECRVSPVNFMEQFAEKPYSDAHLTIPGGLPVEQGRYGYYYLPFSASFSKYNPATTRVLGVNNSGQPDFLVIFRGKGRIFLHCDPRAFSNYFLLQHNNYQYVEKVFALTDAYPEHVYWNNFYPKLRSGQDAGRRRGGSDEEGFSSLATLLSYPPLAKAFWLTLALLMLYILFGIKRRQRIIEIVRPNDNSTVAFTETIGRLYLQKKDNKNIADKMVTYFNEYIRNNYFLNTHIINEAFITTLSRKSGVSRDRVESLYRAIGYSQRYAEIDDFQLLSLNEQIRDFYKRIK